MLMTLKKKLKTHPFQQIDEIKRNAHVTRGIVPSIILGIRSPKFIRP